MILSGQTIRRLCQNERGEFATDDKWGMIRPFHERTVEAGMTHGLSVAGYDIRIDTMTKYGENVNSIRMDNGDFVLACSMERIKMPSDVIAFVKDKSSWARKGLAVQNTVLEPGWEGFITLELSFHRPAHHVIIKSGMPIAQIIFQRLDEPAEKPYDGKYQNQTNIPVEAIAEE